MENYTVFIVGRNGGTFLYYVPRLLSNREAAKLCASYSLEFCSCQAFLEKRRDSVLISLVFLEESHLVCGLHYILMPEAREF